MRVSSAEPHAPLGSGGTLPCLCQVWQHPSCPWLVHTTHHSRLCLCPHTASFCVCVQASFLGGHTYLISLGSIQIQSDFILTHSIFKGPVSKFSHSLKYQG